jgi:hypothetical protein
MSSLMGYQVGVQPRKFKRLILQPLGGLVHIAAYQKPFSSTPYQRTPAEM